MSCNLGGVHKPLKIGVLYAKKTCWGTNDSLCLWWNLLPLTLILCFGILATFFGAPKRMTRGVDKEMLGAAQISLKSYRTKKSRGSSTSHVFLNIFLRSTWQGAQPEALAHWDLDGALLYQHGGGLGRCCLEPYLFAPRRKQCVRNLQPGNKSNFLSAVELRLVFFTDQCRTIPPFMSTSNEWTSVASRLVDRTVHSERLHNLDPCGIFCVPALSYIDKFRLNHWTCFEKHWFIWYVCIRWCA